VVISNGQTSGSTDNADLDPGWNVVGIVNVSFLPATSGNQTYVYGGSCFD
jgi:hypothetical protein